ncbi:MAG: RtcB family protein [Oscillospiraceae bacterium]|nr:RtcB family protein [Oscillospiraceae bacterium]
MYTITGKYNEAIVFSDYETMENTAYSQIMQLCNQEFTKGAKIRIMPDVHAGAGCTIGTTMTIRDKVVPNLVGVDIGCGMEVVRLDNKRINLPELDKAINENIPCGFEIRSREHKFNDLIELDELKCKRQVNLDRARRSIGTLGGGNHFIEADKDSDGILYFVVHSGSRHLGTEVATYYQNEAYRRLNKNSKKDIDELIKELKRQGRDKDIQQALEESKLNELTSIPKALAYAEDYLFDDYIHDMKIVQKFADINRKAMVEEIRKKMKFDIIEQFMTVHNYIETETMILRKGAVSAKDGEKLLIPMNMRDGSLICIGKGNPDWNFSAPHGAGRIMSRSEAKHSLILSEFRKQMDGIYSTTISNSTIDEAPMAYKPMEEIIKHIGGTVEIYKTITPVYNFKAAE